MRLLLIIAVIVLGTVSARAEWGYRWVWHTHCDYTYGYCNRVPMRMLVRWHRTYVDRDRYEDRRRDEDGRRGRCLDHEIEVVSTEHTSEDNARDAARKLWMAASQWRDGGRFMDLDQAADVRWRCGPSSPMDTITGRISQAAGALVGHDGQNVRCQLWARPCEAPREHDGDRRR